ncbi:MAG: diguanylate cyclase [Chlamydiae bacterium]|nr:diguanylate cyclase [Chlamydiota bacterium]
MNAQTTLPIVLFIGTDIGKVTFIKRALKGSYYVMDSKDSHTAFEWLKTIPIQTVILDFNTLDEPLFNLCQHIKKTPGLEKTPILLITNKIQKAFTVDALNAGVTDFIHEPLDASEIHERMAVCLKSQMITKKMSLMTSKINSSPLIPKNTQTFLHRMLLDDKTLKEISKAKKIDMPLTLLMIALDNHDMFIKAYGELTLEEIILFLEEYLNNRLRKFDTLMPQGNGKYLLMLPKTSQSAAKIIAEDIRKEICRTTIHTKKKEILVTVSIGVVSFDKKLSDAAAAYEQFDQSLERVKKSLEKAQKKGNKIVSDSS